MKARNSYLLRRAFLFRTGVGALNSRCPYLMKWEVEKSLQLGKGVIAVHKGDTPASKIPSCIKGNGIKVVPWKKLSDNI